MANSNGIFRFDGRRFVVTGAARGIGFAIARLAAASGAAVAILDLEGPTLSRQPRSSGTNSTMPRS